MADELRDPPGEMSREPGHVRSRILSGTAALPSLVTLGNGIAGFAAIHFATKPLLPGKIAEGEAAAAAWVAGNLVIAAWMIFGGMICDALDGRLARMTGQTSEFGAELDSLCDAITFGVAPAVLMLRTVQAQLYGFVQEVDILPSAGVAGRAVWFIAAMYACCAILRLARFNVENEPDLAAHMEFKGLPSPAAAMSVTSLVLLHEHVAAATEGWRAAAWLTRTVIWAIPVITLASALLMVSRIRFVHVANRYLRGRRSFGHIVTMAAIILAAVVYFRVALAAAFLAFVVSGPVQWLWRKARHRGDPEAAPASDD